jgi:hypothetical protein
VQKYDSSCRNTTAILYNLNPASWARGDGGKGQNVRYRRNRKGLAVSYPVRVCTYHSELSTNVWSLESHTAHVTLDSNPIHSKIEPRTELAESVNSEDNSHLGTVPQHVRACMHVQQDVLVQSYAASRAQALTRYLGPVKSLFLSLDYGILENGMRIRIALALLREKENSSSRRIHLRFSVTLTLAPSSTHICLPPCPTPSQCLF